MNPNEVITGASELHAVRINAKRYVALRDAFVKEMKEDGAPDLTEAFDRQADHLVNGTDPGEDLLLQQMMVAAQ
jgi:hypothetical protein